MAPQSGLILVASIFCFSYTTSGSTYQLLLYMTWSAGWLWGAGSSSDRQVSIECLSVCLFHTHSGTGYRGGSPTAFRFGDPALCGSRPL